jgi:drug/metabolite transporter (DMT)-like permease
MSAPEREMIVTGPHPRKIDLHASFACLGSLICWSVAPIFIKLLTGALDSWTQNALRYGVACLFWLPFLLASIRNGSFDRRIWKLTLLPTAINLLSQSCFTASFYYIHPAFVDLAGKSSLLWIMGISLLLFVRERALLRSKRFWSGIVLSAIGLVGVMVFHADFGQKQTMTGIVLIQIAAACWAAYTLIIRARFADIDSRAMFAVICLYMTVGLTVLGFFFGRMEASLTLSAWQWFWVVFSAITGIAISHVLYYSALHRIGAMIPAMVMLAVPFCILSLSHWVFGETLTAMQWPFGVMLLIGAGLAIWSQEHLHRG